MKALTLLAGLCNGYANPKTLSYVYGQFGHETGGFTSNVFINGKNVAGMQPVTKRPTVGQTGRTIGAESSAVYSSVSLSVYDYFLRCRYYKMPNSFADIGAFNKWQYDSGYYTANTTDYLAGIKNWSSDVYVSGVTFLAAVAASVVVLYMVVSGGKFPILKKDITKR